MPFLERIFNLAELAEDGFVVLRGNADAGVGNLEQNRPGILAQTVTVPRGVNFSALETRLRRICETLPSSVYIGGRSDVLSKISSTDVLSASRGFSMPFSALNNSSTSNALVRILILPASTFARSSRSLTIS
jgi:hypothetical protein